MKNTLPNRYVINFFDELTCIVSASSLQEVIEKTIPSMLGKYNFNYEWNIEVYDMEENLLAKQRWCIENDEANTFPMPRDWKIYTKNVV